MIASRSIVDLVRDHALFAGLGEAFVETVAGCGRNAAFRQDEYLFRAGAPANVFYLLRHGAVSLECLVPGRGVRSFISLGPGAIVGVSWLSPPYVWDFDARAIRPIRALAFDAACLRAKCEDDPAIGYALMQRLTPVLIQRLQAARMQSLDLYGAPAEPST